ncbi:MAG: VWA domain-containing protein, partial [Candidatus Electrothrix sp. AUS3]|nr:VWA domain-containing protein [Candidatus Electrothrix gigas]
MFYPKKAEPEWIELYNGSEQDVDIIGYEISNSKDTVYKIPETLPPVPAGAFVLVVFDGKDFTEDDSSFEGDSLATLHATRRNVFADDSDSCIIFSGKSHSAKKMQAFTAWGDAETLNASVKKNAQHAVKKGLRSRHSTKVYTDRQLRIEGPVPIVEEGWALILKNDKNKHSGFTEIPVRSSEITPGKPNLLPAPQLHLPHTALHTSADLFTFSWIPIEGTSYQIQIAHDPDFKEIVVNAKDLKKPRFRPTSRLKRNVMLYWRVRAADEGKESGWSETRTFIADAPDVTSIEGAPTTLKEGLPNPLGVGGRPARKDSSLLCVDGCDVTHWDKSNATGAQHDHSTWYCWAAAAQMLNWYRGGSLLQDEIVATVKGDITTSTAQPSPHIPHGVTPENSLPHESHAGASREDGYHSLRYALQATNTELHVIDDEKPESDELREFIDSGRPLRYSTGGHAMVVDGDRTTAAGVFQARFLNTDNDGQVEWRTWSTEPFAWCAVPDADLTGRTGDSRMTADSDGDGMVDFDEDERFPTDEKYKDSEWDGVRDKEDVASYALRKISADVDSDGIRGEVDPDSDNGGFLDGQEDLDWDGKYEVADGETDPHDPTDETEIDIDLVLLIDTTGSMGDDIDAVKTAAEKIVDAIDDGAGSYRIAVMSFEDFPEDPYGSADCGDYMYHDVLDFSSTKADIVNAINSLTLRCGADWPESHYSALMHSLEKDALGGWRDGVQKVVIFMSDAPPHSPEPNTGYVAADVIQASIDLDPAIIYPILIGGDPTAEAYYEALASGTGGKVFKAADASEVVDTVIESIETVVNAPIALPGGPYSACRGDEILFDASASYDPDGTIALYKWDFENDGVYDAEATEPTIRYTYPFDYNGTISLRVQDNDFLFNTNSGVTSVRIGDDTAPVVVTQNITVQLDADGNASIAAADIDNGSYDNCGIASMSVSPSSFTCADIGANTVILTVTDNNGNSSTATATITVEDNIAPTAVTKDITIQLDADGNASIAAADIDNGSYDNCGIASMSVSPSSFTCADIGA